MHFFFVFLIAFLSYCVAKNPLNPVKIISQGQPSYESYQNTAFDAAQQRLEAQQQQLKKLQVANLLKQTSTASLGVLFGALIWRGLAVFDEAGMQRKGFLRTVSLPITLLILVANIAGFLVNVFKPNNFKNYLKGILALNIVREWIDLMFNLILVLVRPWNRMAIRTPREVFFGRIFINMWWMTLCFGFSKSRWVSATGMRPIPGTVGNHHAQSRQQNKFSRNYT